MNFGQSRALWMLLLFVPLLSLFLWWSWRKKQSLIRQFVHSRLLAQLTTGVSPQRQKLRLVLVVLAVCFLILSLARPQWGFTWEEATQRGRDIVVAIDTSRSMLATDVAPNRLTRAKLAALDLLRLAKQDRLGLVAFAGSAFLQCPLTLDDEAFRQSVNILEPGIIPQGGTALSEAIEASLGAFSKEEGENHRVLVIFTDGEDHESGINEAIKKAKEEGLRIFTVGVGTPAGELIRVTDERGASTFLKDEQGNTVKSKLDEALLKQIATDANGFYLPLRGPNTMDTLYEKGLATLPTTEFSAKLVKHYKEQYYWPLGLAMLLLITEMFVVDQRRGKRRAAEQSATAAPLAKAAGLAFLLGLASNLSASPARAMKNYTEGNYRDSFNEYQELLRAKPDDPRLHYNAGAAAYQAKKYDAAVKEFSEAATAPNLELQQMAYYNMGNAQFRLGESESDPKQKLRNWEDAVRKYESALKLNPNDADARYNRELVQRKIEELKKQQQQNQKDKNQQKDNKDDKNKDEQDKQKDQNNKDDKKDQQKQDQEQKDNQQQQDQQNQQQKQDQQKQDEEKKKQQEQKQQQDQASADQKKEGDKDKAQQGSKDDKKDQEQQQGTPQMARAGVMTPEQAQQLLEAQKGEERALIFLPQNRKGAPHNRILKDW